MAKTRNPDGTYRTVHMDRIIAASMLAVQEIPDDLVVLHLNGNGTDCRRSNLHVMTVEEALAYKRMNPTAVWNTV